MSTIQFIRLNNTDTYDLYSNGAAYIAGEGIYIDANGVIRIDPDYVSPSTKALIAGTSEQISLLKVGLDGITAVVNTTNTALGSLQSVVTLLPGEMRTEFLAVIDSEGKRLEHIISEGYNGTYDAIIGYINSEGYVNKNELIRTTSEMISHISGFVTDSEMATIHESIILQTEDMVSIAVQELDSEGGFIRRSQIQQTADEIKAEVVSKLDSEGGYVRKSQLKQTADEIKAEIVDGLDSEGGYVKKSVFRQTTDGIETDVKDLNENLESTVRQTAGAVVTEILGEGGDALKHMSFTPDGLKIAVSADSRDYSIFDETGMKIYQKGKVIASATDQLFKANAFGLSDWRIARGSNTYTLNIFREI